MGRKNTKKRRQPIRSSDSIIEEDHESGFLRVSDVEPEESQSNQEEMEDHGEEVPTLGKRSVCHDALKTSTVKQTQGGVVIPNEENTSNSARVESIVEPRQPKRRRGYKRPSPEYSEEKIKEVYLQRVPNLLESCTEPVLEACQKLTRRLTKDISIKSKILDTSFNRVKSGSSAGKMFNRTVTELPGQIHRKAQLLEQTQIMVHSKEKLIRGECKDLKKYFRRHRQRQDHKELIETKLQTRGYFDPQSFSTRHNLKSELPEAIAFYTNDIKKYANLLGRTPQLCVHCWRIVFFDSKIFYTDSRSKLPILWVIDPYLADVETSLTAKQKQLQGLGMYSNHMRGGVDPECTEYFPGVLLPDGAGTKLHACLQQPYVKTIPLQEYVKLARTVDPSKAQKYLNSFKDRVRVVNDVGLTESKSDESSSELNQESIDAHEVLRRLRTKRMQSKPTAKSGPKNLKRISSPVPSDSDADVLVQHTNRTKIARDQSRQRQDSLHEQQQEQDEVDESPNVGIPCPDSGIQRNHRLDITQKVPLKDYNTLEVKTADGKTTVFRASDILIMTLRR